MTKKRSFVWYKFNGLYRYMLVHLFADFFPLYVVNEYPKSGGSWIGEMLGNALEVPFPRNMFPVLQSSILHGHMMQSWNMNNVLCVWRDGRDVIVSQYYHWLFENERGNALLVAKSRADLGFANYEDIGSNLTAFMEYVFEKPNHPKFTWTEFVNKWADCEKCVHVRYEDMRIQPVEELRRIVRELSGERLGVTDATRIVDLQSFERLSGRKVGQINTRSFLRSGVVGDWKNHFSLDARKKFNSYAGEALIKLGYESDSTWVEEIPHKAGG